MIKRLGDDRQNKKDICAKICMVVFFLLGCFFKFVLVGYQTIALIFFGAAGILLLLYCLPVRWVRCFIVGLLIVSILGLGLIEIPIIAASQGDASDDASCLIVLGAGVNGVEPSLSLQQRLMAAYVWLENHPKSIAVLSGGQGNGEQISEAEAMYRWLTKQGITEERLYKEEYSSSTQENLLYSAEVLRKLDPTILSNPIAVVSSEYHLYRAKIFARQAGIQAIGVPARTTWPILRLNYFIREGFAVARLWILGY